MKKRITFVLKPLLLWSLAFLIITCSQEELPEPTPSQQTGVGGKKITVLEDEVNGVPLVIIGSRGLNFSIAFERSLNGTLRTFAAVQGQLPVVAEDDLGNRWDVFGRALSGPDKGRQLAYVNSGMGYWFAFGAIYPGVDIYGLGSRQVALNQDTLAGWDIPTGEVAQGTGFDGITTLNDPPFFTFNQLKVDPETGFFLDDNDLVVVVTLERETKVYPHAILDWHEVVNDVVGGIPVSITYCPLTGTAKVWQRVGTDISSYFGVSGLLYNSNVLPFDRSTESFWHQLEARGVFGDRLGKQLTIVPHIETTWGSWKQFEPNPLVMSPEAGNGRDYSVYPYGDYRDSEIISYPIAFDDDRLSRKERVFSVIIDGYAKVYRLLDFEK